MDSKKYLIISLLLIVYTLAPFFISFERRKPHAREIVVLAIMCALAVAGRMVFYSFAQIKPVAAIVIITGICFGYQSGFLVGAMSMFISNIFMGHGPWTPWQMLTFALIGALAGIVFKSEIKRPNKWVVAIFGFVVTFLFSTLILDTATIIIADTVSIKALLASFATGFVFNLVHAISTSVFLVLLTNPILDKMQRVKQKYGLSLN
ncbi:MAG: ECF transporter S component [Oscillospiraceae bacterium]|nr:ECF transporter S component [Oscillospiraceae bacterium]